LHDSSSESWQRVLIKKPNCKQQLQRHFQANTIKKRNVLSTIRMGKELLRRRHDYPISADDLLCAAKKLAELSLIHGCWGYEL